MAYLTKHDLEKLQEVRKHLEMRNCSFSAPDKWPCDGNWPERDEDFTSAVREATEIWRDSWILPVIDEIIAKAKRQPLAR